MGKAFLELMGALVTNAFGIQGGDTGAFIAPEMAGSRRSESSAYMSTRW